MSAPGAGGAKPDLIVIDETHVWTDDDFQRARDAIASMNLGIRCGLWERRP